MPMDAKNYPDNWQEIALAIKEQAEWKCEQCRRECRLPSEKFDTHKRTLTVAHINHVPMDCRPENLVALCPKCHLAYDTARRKLQRLAAKRIARELVYNQSFTEFREELREIAGTGWDGNEPVSKDCKQQIHDIASSLLPLKAIPECVDKSCPGTVAAYRVGVMKLAEALTGQTVREADAATISRAIADSQDKRPR